MYNILVVDDDKEIVSAIEIYLSKEGYHILKAYERGSRNSFNMEDFEKKYWWEIEQKLLFPAEYAMDRTLHNAYAKGAETSYRIQKSMVEDDRK